jgi:hypothetical protein
MSYYGGGMGMGGGGGSQQMVSMSSSLMLLSAMAAGALLYLNSQKKEPTTPAEKQLQSPALQQQQQMAAAANPVALNTNVASSPGSVARGLDGRYTVKYGAMSLTVDPKDCKTNNVWFSEGNGIKMEWNLKTVPGYEDVYTLRSEERGFNKGCDMAYLQAPSSCNGPATLARPASTDLQNWQLVPSTNGGYEIRNVSCSNKRWPSYMISSGNQGDITNTARLADRAGSPYTLRKV